MKRKKNKNLRRAVGFVLMAAIVAGLAAMPLLTADKVPEAEFPLSTWITLSTIPMRSC